MKREGCLEAFIRSKDILVYRYPQECVPPCRDARLYAWPCARHMWVPALLKRMAWVYRELCSSSGSGTSVYSHLTPNTRATGSRDSSEMASSLSGGRRNLFLKPDTSYLNFASVPTERAEFILVHVIQETGACCLTRKIPH